MKSQGDARGADRKRTLLLLVSVVALFFFGIILRRIVWP
jgi:hypothetical protein